MTTMTKMRLRRNIWEVSTIKVCETCEGKYWMVRMHGARHHASAAPQLRGIFNYDKFFYVLTLLCIGGGVQHSISCQIMQCICCN